MKKIIIVLACLLSLGVFNVSAAGKHLVWEEKGGKQYWYENNKIQGVYGSPGNVWYDDIERGREIFDPKSNGWYWLDAVYGGAKAVNKEVFMPYVYSNEKEFDEATIDSLAEESNTYTENYGPVANMGDQVKKAIKEGTGKWVRYDFQGKMIKGWYTVFSKEDQKLYPNQVGNTYYYDYKTGLMAKGWTNIGGTNYYFDELTGVLTGEYGPENCNNIEGRRINRAGFRLQKIVSYDLFEKDEEGNPVYDKNDNLIYKYKLSDINNVLLNTLDSYSGIYYFDNEGYYINDEGYYLPNVLEYDEKIGAYVEAYYYEDGEIDITIYDNNFNDIEYKNKWDGVEYRYLYYYNDKHDIIKREDYENGIFKESNRRENKYSGDNLIEMKAYDNKTNKLLWENRFTYNDKGLIDVRIDLDDKGYVTEYWKHYYE